MNCFPLAVTVFFGAFAVVLSATPHIEGAAQRNVEQHTAITLECQLPAEAKNVSWYRGEVQIVADAQKEITISFPESSTPATSRKSVLTIAEAEKTDSGVYKCRADGKPSDNEVQITVTGHLHSLTAPSSKVTLIPGSQLTLTCQADIHTHIVWYKGQTMIKPSSGVTVADSEDKDKHIKTSTLTVKQAAAADEGSYSCRDEHHDDEQVVITVRSSAVIGQACAGHILMALLFVLMISFRLMP